jgi:DNA-binding response OmpR family regulator
MYADPVKLLVVDDDRDVADALAAQLALDGYSVRTAYAADDAIRSIEAELPHCVLLDIRMPEIDGCELATILRHRFKDEIVLIAVTGSTEDEVRARDTFAVVDHWFLKPIEPKVLRQVIPPN